MILVVLDTNVLASGFAGFLIPASVPGRLLHAWRAGEIEVVVSEHILTELARSFEQRYFQRRLTPNQVARSLALLQRQATTSRITAEVQGVATHPEDDLILATAVSAQAAYLVTGDSQLQKLGSYRGVTIVSPRDFLDLLQSGGLGGRR